MVVVLVLVVVVVVVVGGGGGVILGEVKARPKDIISFSLDYISKSKVQTSNPSSSPIPLDTPARPADYIYIYICTQISQTTNVIYIYLIIYAIICNMYIIYHLSIFRENIWMILEPVKFFPNETRLYRCCLFGKPCFTFYYRKSPLGRSRNMFGTLLSQTS